jgi:hypothetical protein
MKSQHCHTGVPLMKQLAALLGCQKTATKYLVISPQAKPQGRIELGKGKGKEERWHDKVRSAGLPIRYYIQFHENFLSMLLTGE